MVVRKRLDIAGPAVAFITTTTFEWKPVLTQKSVADIFISALLKTQSLFEVTIKLWKPRFDDLIIQSEKQIRIKMEYIHNNPVKAGLVRRAEDWLYSSAVDWLTTRKGLIGIDKEYHWLTT